MRWLSRLGRGRRDEIQLDDQLAMLLVEHGLLALERQVLLQALVGERDWQFDQNEGTIRFLPDLAFPAQCIGSESDSAHTWLWAWANASIDEGRAQRASEAREIGARRGYAFMNEPEVPLSRLESGHLVGLVICGLTGADAYYRCPYEGGALYVTLDRPGWDGVERPSSAEVVEMAMSVHGALLSRDAIEVYLRKRGDRYTTNEEQVLVDDGPTYTFDAEGRLVEFEYTTST
jgi:hypothetical protein